MKNQEFLEEVLHSGICPENFEEIYKGFEYYQNLALDTLRELHRVCEKNAITYQLAAGSLLGAIRDEGQIPWDYDVDVYVPYEEKDELIEALKRDLSDKYYFYCPEVNRKCRHLFIRLAPMGYRTEILHVDVFYVVGMPEGEVERKQYIEKSSELVDIRFGKYVDVLEEARGSIKLFLRLMQRKMRALVKYNVTEFEHCQRLWAKYPAKETTMCGTLSKNMINRCYDNSIWDSMLMSIDTGTFRVSRKYEYILHKVYGDYNKIPELQGRINEVLVHYKWLSQYGRCK